jgi:hypothetical protein
MSTATTWSFEVSGGSFNFDIATSGDFNFKIQDTGFKFVVAPAAGWILKDGYWDDSGVWIDSEFWKDS